MYIERERESNDDKLRHIYIYIYIYTMMSNKFSINRLYHFDEALAPPWGPAPAPPWELPPPLTGCMYLIIMLLSQLLNYHT